MAVLIDPQVTVNSVDLTDFVMAVEVSEEADAVEGTTAGGAGYRQFEGGLKNASVTLGFKNTYAASAVYATLKGIIGTEVDVEITPTSDTVSATNPTRTYSCIVTQYMPIAGSIGDLIASTVTWQVTGAPVETTS